MLSGCRAGGIAIRIRFAATLHEQHLLKTACISDRGNERRNAGHKLLVELGVKPLEDSAVTARVRGMVAMIELEHELGQRGKCRGTLARRLDLRAFQRGPFVVGQFDVVRNRIALLARVVRALWRTQIRKAA